MNEHVVKTDEAKHRSSNLRTEFALVCFLFVASLLVHLWFLFPSPFDGLYGQDPYAYSDFAEDLRAVISGQHTLGLFYWPLGYPTLLAIGYTLFGAQANTGQAINIILASALAPLVYILARQIGLKRFGGFIAAVLMTLCGQALQSSIVLMADIPGLFWAMLSAVLLWMYFQRENTRHQPLWLMLSAIILAFASITRWLSLVLAVPWAITVMIYWKGHIRWRESMIAIVGAGLIFLPQLLYSATHHWPTPNPPWIDAWTPGNAFKNEFTNMEGHFQYDKINAIYYAQTIYDPYYLATVFTPFVFIGLWRLSRRGTAHLVMIGGWALLPYLFLAGIPYQNIRFPLIVVPAVAIMAAAGLEAAVSWLAKVKMRYMPIAAYTAALLLILFGASQTLSIDRINVGNFINNQQRDKNAAAWATQYVPEGATLYTFGLTLTLKHYTTLNVYELYYETPDTLAQKWIVGQDDYLLVDVWNIEHQWVGHDPQLDYQWLSDKRGLIQLGKYGNFTLYRVRGMNDGNVG